jgi:hypothetical protein
MNLAPTADRMGAGADVQQTAIATSKATLD